MHHVDHFFVQSNRYLVVKVTRWLDLAIYHNENLPHTNSINSAQNFAKN